MHPYGPTIGTNQCTNKHSSSDSLPSLHKDTVLHTRVRYQSSGTFPDNTRVMRRECPAGVWGCDAISIGGAAVAIARRRKRDERGVHFSNSGAVPGDPPLCQENPFWGLAVDPRQHCYLAGGVYPGLAGASVRPGYRPRAGGGWFVIINLLAQYKMRLYWLVCALFSS